MRQLKKRLLAAVKAPYHYVRGELRQNPSRVLIIVVAAIAAAFLFSIDVALIWTIFMLFLFYNWDLRIPTGLGEIALILFVLFAFDGKMAWAEIAAVYAYFFLGIAGLIWLVRYGRTLV